MVRREEMVVVVVVVAVVLPPIGPVWPRQLRRLMRHAMTNVARRGATLVPKKGAIIVDMGAKAAASLSATLGLLLVFICSSCLVLEPPLFAQLRLGQRVGDGVGGGLHSMRHEARNPHRKEPTTHHKNFVWFAKSPTMSTTGNVWLSKSPTRGGAGVNDQISNSQIARARARPSNVQIF
jgi:hypothetical protein